MVALKTAEIDKFIARPDPGRPIALVFGPDTGLVSERATALIRGAVDDMADPFGLVRLDGDELAGDPGRLGDEANTIPLFGGRRAIWIKAGNRDFTAAVEPLVGQTIRDCRIVIEAGDLRRGSTLRTLCERAASIAVIACYPDNERDLSRLIDDEMRAAGLSITPDARAALLPLLGGDRRASRGEIEKLVLYARGNSQVEIDDVEAVVTDASALVLDAIVDAAFAGRPDDVEANFARARQAGMAASRIVTAGLGQAAQLHRGRTAIDRGAEVGDATDQIMSKAQFRRKPAIETALEAWTAAKLVRAIAQLYDAALGTRQLSGPAGALAYAVASRALLGIATTARRRQSS